MFTVSFVDNSEMHENTRATICGLVYGTVLTYVPPDLLSYGEKLLYGATLALITGFTYKAGGWCWERLVRKKGNFFKNES